MGDLRGRTCGNLTSTERGLVQDIYFAEAIVNATYERYRRVREAVEVGDCKKE